MQGESSHAFTNEPFTARVRLRAMRRANSRTRHTKTRLEATLPFRTLEMQLQFSLHAGLFTSGGMLPSAKAHAYARPIPPSLTGLPHKFTCREPMLNFCEAGKHCVNFVNINIP